MAEADATATLIAVLASGFSAVAGILTTITLGKFGSLTKKNEALEEKVHALELENRDFKGFNGTAAAKITALETNAVTREYLKLLTDGQNKTLAENTDMLHAIHDRVTDLDKSKASRSDLKAVRAPVRRQDGPTDSDPPSDPPPAMRPRLPSRPGRYGGE